jgi:hypothetical protein
MATTEDVYVKLKLDSKEFEQNMKRSRGEVDLFERKTVESESALANWGGAIGAATALIGGASTAIAVLTTEVAKSTVETERYAQRLGLATKELLALQQASARFGIENDTINEGLKNMKERLGEAFVQGSGAGFDALKIIGVDLEKIKGLDAEQQFAVIAEALSKVEDQSEKVRLSMEIFAEEGFKMLDFIDKGADGIKELTDREKELSAGFDAKKVKSYGDAVNSLGVSLKQSGDNIATFWAPSLEMGAKAITNFLDWFNVLGTHLDTNPYKDQVESIKELEKALIDIQKIDPFVAQQKEAESLILDRIAGEKTVAQIAFESDSRHGAKEKEASDLRKDIQKRLEEEAKTKKDAQDSLFRTWEEEDKRIAQQKQLDSASGAFQTSGVLERGSVSEASIGAGKANQYEIKSANTLDKMLQLMKKENRSSQLIKVNQL